MGRCQMLIAILGSRASWWHREGTPKWDGSHIEKLSDASHSLCVWPGYRRAGGKFCHCSHVDAVRWWMENLYLPCRIGFYTTWLGHVCCVIAGEWANRSRVLRPWRLLSSRTADTQILQYCSGCSPKVWCFCWSGHSRQWKRAPGVDGLELYRRRLCTLEKQHVRYAGSSLGISVPSLLCQSNAHSSWTLSQWWCRYISKSLFSSRTLWYPNWLGLRWLVMVSTKHFSGSNVIWQCSDQDWSL